MSLKIVKYQEKHLQDLLTFFKKNSSDHPELYDEQILKWQHCSRYIAYMGEMIVGHIAQINHTFIFNNEKINIGWVATLVLDSSNSMTQVFSGTSLLNQVTGLNNKHMAAVGVVPEIEETHKRRGYIIHSDAVRMYARFFKPDNALRFINKQLLFSIPILIVNYLFRAKKYHINADIREIESFDHSLDSLWEKYLSEQYKFYGERTAEFLNYKINQPNKTYKCYLFHNNSGEAEGYIILRVAINKKKNIKLVKICDLVGSLKARKALVSFSIEFAQKYNVDGIISLSSASDSRLYKNCGLWISKKYPVVLSPELNKSIHVTFFESDLDNLW